MSPITTPDPRYTPYGTPPKGQRTAESRPDTPDASAAHYLAIEEGRFDKYIRDIAREFASIYGADENDATRLMLIDAFVSGYNKGCEDMQ